MVCLCTEIISSRVTATNPTHMKPGTPAAAAASTKCANPCCTGSSRTRPHGRAVAAAPWAPCLTNTHCTRATQRLVCFSTQESVPCSCVNCLEYDMIVTLELLRLTKKRRTTEQQHPGQPTYMYAALQQAGTSVVEAPGFVGHGGQLTKRNTHALLSSSQSCAEQQQRCSYHTISVRPLGVVRIINQCPACRVARPASLLLGVDTHTRTQHTTHNPLPVLHAGSCPHHNLHLTHKPSGPYTAHHKMTDLLQQPQGGNKPPHGLR